MLAELAIANSAFAVIKQTIANGQDLTRVAKQATSYFDSKSEIAKKASKNGNKSDMEAFMALEALKKQEEELRELMIYAGRANLYDDWLQFQADCKRKRRQEEVNRQRKAIKNKELVTQIITGVVVVLVAVPSIIGLTYTIVRLFE